MKHKKTRTFYSYFSLNWILIAKSEQAKQQKNRFFPFACNILDFLKDKDF